MASTELVSVRIPSDEKARWEMLALAQGFASLSDYVRDVVTAYSDGLTASWGVDRIKQALEDRRRAEDEAHEKKWRQLNDQVSATLRKLDSQSDSDRPATEPNRRSKTAAQRRSGK